jgi:hypothetical protein
MCQSIRLLRIVTPNRLKYKNEKFSTIDFESLIPLEMIQNSFDKLIITWVYIRFESSHSNKTDL